MKVIVIGGGPAGMVAAITAAENGDRVVLLEKMKDLGTKLLITGKGRCNITSSLPIEDFIENIPGNGQFLYSSFKNYTNKDIIRLLEYEGLEVKEERGNRVFPVTNKAIDVLTCFKKRLKKLNVEIHCNSKVIDIIEHEELLQVLTKDGEIYTAEKIILATGGKSYPLTGSTGDGYRIARKLGHTIAKLKPSLVPLECYDKNICKALQGLSLRNVKIQIINTEKNKIIYEDFGEMIFTHYGVSGPIILSASAHLVRYKNIDRYLEGRNIILNIDLKPALSEEKLEKRIIRDFSELKNKKLKNALDGLLPQKLIPVIINEIDINPEKKINEITREERWDLVDLLKNFELEIADFRPIEEAIVTSGGINIKEINPKTMESKIVPGLYFAGEIIDVDAYTGGFNLQIAYSTGYTAGK